MTNQFDPNSRIIRLLMQGMAMEDQDKPEEASSLFTEAWSEAAEDFERFIAAYFVARHQKTMEDRLKWLETSLKYALIVNDDAAKSALPSIYLNIAKCHEELGNLEEAKISHELSNSHKVAPSDKGPFYHGTRADLQVGDLLTARMDSNYKSDLKMNHIYFTALIHGAGLAAALAKGEGPERVYIVEPTGEFENDPNVTDKKFPGNLTRSYRSQEPLKIIGEATEWLKQTTEDIRKWREKLANSTGEIID